MQHIMSTVEQRHCASVPPVENGNPRIGLRIQLLAVTPAEFVPTLWAMSEPPPQFRTGRDLLQPRVRLKVRFAHASRPKSLDQDSLPVAPGSRIIRTIEPGRDEGSSIWASVYHVHQPSCLFATWSIVSRARAECA